MSVVVQAIRALLWRWRYRLSDIEAAALERLVELGQEWIPRRLADMTEIRLAVAYIRFRDRGWAEHVASHEGGFLYQITEAGRQVLAEAPRRLTPSHSGAH